MTADQRQTLYQRALADLTRRGSGYVLFSEKGHGDNYVEVAADMRVEVSHRRWPASKLPALDAHALQKLDRLGFREAERNLAGSWAGWAVPRMAKSLESVFLEGYGCTPSFDVEVATGQ